MNGSTMRIVNDRDLQASIDRLAERHVFDVAVHKTRTAMTLADPNLPGCPLVYVNPAFERLTGYGSDDVIGRNCRFLQGPRTDGETVRRIAQAIRGRSNVEEEIYNYRRDGSGFWNALCLSPVFDDTGTLVYFFASQLDVTERRQALDRQTLLLGELQHRTRNIMGVIEALSKQTLRRSRTLAEFGPGFEGRLGALARSQTMLAEGGDDTIGLRELVTMELDAHGARAGAGVHVEGPAIALPAAEVQILALALHELATNAVKYGALGQPAGRLDVVWRIADNGRAIGLEWRETGVTMPPTPDLARTGFGSELIVRALPHQLGAETSLERMADGMLCSILLPIASAATGDLHA